MVSESLKLTFNLLTV